MSEGAESTSTEPSPAEGVTAGSLLRQARTAKGLHIAALASAIKVTPRKLELLEADRFDELPGATFTRALAQTVCRTLKIDSAPVLALLPQPVDEGLARMSVGLNEPFRDRPGQRVPSELPWLKSPVLLGAAVLAVASVVLYLLPAGWVSDMARSRPASEPDAAPAVSVTTITSTPVVATPASSTSAAASMPSMSAAASVAAPASASAPVPAIAASVAPPVPASAAPSGGALLLRAQGESWVEVVDARGQTLISRLLQPGETVGLDGSPPLKLKIGNAAATQVSFRGKPVDLAASRDNVAKIELR